MNSADAAWMALGDEAWEEAMTVARVMVPQAERERVREYLRGDGDRAVCPLNTHRRMDATEVHDLWQWVEA